MDFIAYQESLQDHIWDTRTQWNTSGTATSLKLAIKHGLKETKNRLMTSSFYKEKNYEEITKTITDKKCDAPTDVLGIFRVYVWGDEIYKYSHNKTQGKIIFEDETTGDALIKFIPKVNTLSADADIPNVDEYFEDAIIAYAMEKYHMLQEDWDNVSRVVAYAEEKADDLISKYY